MELFTIGHSNHPIEKFIRLLMKNGVTTLIDVRTSPYSRYNPQFNREALASEVQMHGLQYKFAGQYLGGRPADATCYKGGALPDAGADYLHLVDYTEVMKRPWFTKAIQRLLQVAAEQPTAIMCSEEDPAECHRHHLISQFILYHDPDAIVVHIRGDGTTFKAQSIRKSLDKPSHEQLSLFGEE